MLQIKNWINWIMGTRQKNNQAIINESSEDSFPASDPPSWAGGIQEIKQHTIASDLVLTSEFHKSTQQILSINGIDYHYYSLRAAEQGGLKDLSKLPYTLKILLENLLRHLDRQSVTVDDLKAIIEWLKLKTSNREIVYRPARVLMQDFTGVPAIVDLAAMRAAIEKLGGNPEQINPLSAVDLIIDHSIQIDQFLISDAFTINATMEMERNYERYEFLRWGQKAFRNFRVVPPDTGICHQVNLEYLAKTVWTQEINGKIHAYPDTLVGTDSHTTMINGLGVLGWGVGGIEAEAAMLGQPISLLIPEVIGVKLTGQLQEGITATDLVLSVTHLLREKGVVGKFVEFFGDGLRHLSLADRATISNMSPEYGATCGFFPIDEATLDYLRLSGREEQSVALVEAYAKIQGLWHDPQVELVYTDLVTLDLSTIRACIAGPKRPQDQVELSNLANTFDKFLVENKRSEEREQSFSTDVNYELHHGDVVIAAITSCTNTSNPNVLIAAGLLAKKAVEKGMTRKPWVKTSFAPGSQVVTLYLEKTNLQKYLNELGFTLAGYGCTTCIGNSGPLPEPVEKTVIENDLIVSAVLSGNRNFEGRIHPLVKANWLASPPLVVAFALAGTVLIDVTKDPLGEDKSGNPVYLKDLWPTNDEIAREVANITSKMFHDTYANIFMGTKEWRAMKVSESDTYAWPMDSTYIQHPPFFDGMGVTPEKIKNIKGARILALFGDSITTDHISPAGSIKPESPAGEYLQSKGVLIKDFNSYGSRRGNHEVMVRGTFANIRIRNEMTPELEGGFTKYIPTSEIMSIYDAAMRYKKAHTALVVIAGKEYGTGSSRDWAAKGPKLQGVVAVVAESFERIHRSNLIGMGILPLEFPEGVTRKTLNITGSELIDIIGLTHQMKPRMRVKVVIHREDGNQTEVTLISRIDTLNELDYYKNGGILHYVLRGMLKK
ncbi:aconitate hydratase AcnA [Legionella longbeachae]|uniref:Aconitate hydratase n=1 Tax=Legionella longbeachae serogroup 1 (strain NSW150) TaxID=661367 RepID=D3HLN9_LEGLN|nr:aconitate hydratase AcnA [Legionella longbeachae]VEE03801.1 aconitate hydratase 1 [Legionella oakridgensis]ARB93328.1 aconitate hydratase AcnA [Legionella longbeachae]ARM33608.1 aconitate hydratase AcnA [Legionella longbeachae]EEZ93539.1 aconitate hydratase 1 [Legionella longbeachae D-4968]RZV20554.1 aconitate hydratase AcnA [Legionella longbeachae]